jgi:hypothetical protein
MTRNQDSQFVQRAVVLTDLSLSNSDMLAHFGDIDSDEVIILTTAKQADLMEGSIKLSGCEPKNPSPETLFRHMKRAILRRLGIAADTHHATNRSQYDALAQRLRLLRPDRVYADRPEWAKLAEKLRFEVYPIPKPTS